MSLLRETYQLFVDVDDEPLSVVAVRITNEESQFQRPLNSILIADAQRRCPGFPIGVVFW
jgi:hypothetical protein